MAELVLEDELAGELVDELDAELDEDDVCVLVEDIEP